jgi:pimeloyl-ACP methyl ester carboxylesterase
MINEMIREAHVTIEDRKTRYLEAGSGWPVVLIHAFPLNADMWRPQLERVPDGWRFIAPDLRGFGPASGPPSVPPATAVDDFAGDVGTLLDRLHIDRAIIGGLSMGGYVTFALFRKSPERFSGLMLADTKASADSAEGREGRRKMIELVRASGATAVADQMLPKLLGAASTTARPELQSEVRQMIESTSVAAIAGALEALSNRPDSTPDLARMTCPALIVVGAEDVLTPVADAEAMDRRIARSSLVVLPGAGHLSNLESPDAFSRALADFLASSV